MLAAAKFFQSSKKGDYDVSAAEENTAIILNCSRIEEYVDVEPKRRSDTCVYADNSGAAASKKDNQA